MRRVHRCSEGAADGTVVLSCITIGSVLPIMKKRSVEVFFRLVSVWLFRYTACGPCSV